MKNKVLLIITVIIVIIAICIVIFIPNKQESTITSNNTSNNISSQKLDATLNEVGDVEVKLESLDLDNATFINYETINGYVVELIAVKDSDNNVNVAFNTCQICNGSPRAYFVQVNGKLMCKNCGNIFSLNSVGKEAVGCNPMSLDDKDITKTEIGITISKEILIQNEKLFTNVAKH